MVTSFGSSTGVRKRTMPAAPAMPNARASELPMMIIIIAPDTHSSVCACSSDLGRSRLDGWWMAVTSAPMSAEAIILASSMNGCRRWTGRTSIRRPLSSNCSVAGSSPVSWSGHLRPIQTSAEQSATPATTIRTVRQGQAARRAASTDSYVTKMDDRRDASSICDTAGRIAARRRLPPSRCAVVCPRTSARIPALSMIDTPPRSMIRWRRPVRKSCWMSRSNASAAPPATSGTWGDRTRRSTDFGLICGTVKKDRRELYTEARPDGMVVV